MVFVPQRKVIELTEALRMARDWVVEVSAFLNMLRTPFLIRTRLWPSRAGGA